MSLKIRDEVTPDLKRKAAALADRRPVLDAMGTALVSITVRAFRDAALRAMPWPARRDGSTNSLLLGTPKTEKGKPAGRSDPHLRPSIRVVSVTQNNVTVGSDRPYAAIHQVGGTTKPHEIVAKYKGALYWPGAAHPVKKVNHPGSKIPARPFFPFTPDGRMTPHARETVENVARAKIDKLLGL